MAQTRLRLQAPDSDGAEKPVQSFERKCPKRFYSWKQPHAAPSLLSPPTRGHPCSASPGASKGDGGTRRRMQGGYRAGAAGGWVSAPLPRPWRCSQREGGSSTAQTFPGGWKSRRTCSSDETLPTAGAAFQLHGSFEG